MKTNASLFTFLFLFLTSCNCYAQYYDQAKPIVSSKKANLYRISLNRSMRENSSPIALKELATYYIYQSKKNKKDLVVAKSYLGILKKKMLKLNIKQQVFDLDILEAVLASKIGDSLTAENSLSKLANAAEKLSDHDAA
ncbi:MAG: hypothetical protein EOO07_20110, partial [Chitinophagaceae bacterium]